MVLLWPGCTTVQKCLQSALQFCRIGPGKPGLANFFFVGREDRSLEILTQLVGVDGGGAEPFGAGVDAQNDEKGERDNDAGGEDEDGDGLRGRGEGLRGGAVAWHLGVVSAGKDD